MSTSDDIKNYYAGLTSPGWSHRGLYVGSDCYIALYGDILTAYAPDGDEVASWVDLAPSKIESTAEWFWMQRGGKIVREAARENAPAGVPDRVVRITGALPPSWEDTDRDVVQAAEDEHVGEAADAWQFLTPEEGYARPWVSLECAPPTKTVFVVCALGTYYAGNGRGVTDRDAAKKYATRANALADMNWQCLGAEIQEIEDRAPSKECGACGGSQPSCPECHPTPAPDCMDCGKTPCGCLETAKSNLFLSGALGAEQHVLEAALRRAGLANDVAVWHISPTGDEAARGPACVYTVRSIEIAALPSVSVDFGYSAGVIRIEVHEALMPFSNVLQFIQPEVGYEPAWPDRAAGTILGLCPSLRASGAGRVGAEPQNVSVLSTDPLLFAYVYYRYADGSEESEEFPVSLDIAKGLKAGADPRVFLADELREFGIPADALLRVSVELTDPGNTKDTTAEPVWVAPTVPVAGAAWLEQRVASVARMVGHAVEVTRLGEGPRPEADPNLVRYVPLPEYGVALWLRQAITAP